MKIDELVFTKIKNVCSSKNNVKRIKIQSTYLEEKIFVNHIFDKEFASIICKESTKQNSKKIINQIKSEQKAKKLHQRRYMDAMKRKKKSISLTSFVISER